MFFHHKFDHVFEGSPAPRISFVVCAMPRSGSSLLCELLAGTELAGAPTEFFDLNHMNEFRRIWGVATFDEYIEALLAKKTSPNGVFGFKAHYHQLIDAFGDVDLGGRFPNVHLVHISRRDRVRQAVSFALATQTDQWTSLHEPPADPPTYDAEQIRGMVDWIDREEIAWNRYSAARDAPVLRVVYEDFVDAIEETVLDVMRFLQIELPADFRLPQPTLHRQAGPLNDDWVERFVLESGAR
jgi:trehalose 2-sulfotransferase